MQMNEQASGKHLTKLIQPTDILHLHSGAQVEAVSLMQPRRVWQGLYTFFVSCRMPSGYCMPVHSNAIIAVERNGCEVYRENDTPIQMSLFDLEQAS